MTNREYAKTILRAHLTNTALAGLYVLAADEHIAAGGIVPPMSREMFAQRRYGSALMLLVQAHRSDFRTRPFRGL